MNGFNRIIWQDIKVFKYYKIEGCYQLIIKESGYLLWEKLFWFFLGLILIWILNISNTTEVIHFWIHENTFQSSAYKTLTFSKHLGSWINNKCSFDRFERRIISHTWYRIYIYIRHKIDISKYKTFNLEFSNSWIFYGILELRKLEKKDEIK